MVTFSYYEGGGGGEGGGRNKPRGQANQLWRGEGGREEAN